MPYLETAVEIAREAGALLANFFERRVAFELKGEFDLVTEADRASEKLVVERLRSHFPSHGIVAEEGGGHQSVSDFRWFVDPLDGTTNFAHSFPIFNVTLGLEQAGEMVAGVIYDPIRQEMFTAERGAGAYLNHRRIRVSAAKRLEDSLASTGFPSRKRHQNVNIHFYHQMAMASHGVRRTGSAAIDLAWVACGRLDGFWCGRPAAPFPICAAPRTRSRLRNICWPITAPCTTRCWPSSAKSSAAISACPSPRFSSRFSNTGILACVALGYGAHLLPVFGASIPK
jgi:myo-inositol-1(or 4)-monophosphatase